MRAFRPVVRVTDCLEFDVVYLGASGLWLRKRCLERPRAVTPIPSIQWLICKTRAAKVAIMHRSVAAEGD